MTPRGKILKMYDKLDKKARKAGKKIKPRSRKGKS